MIDFIIVTAPRSGSHMLATALDCHPDISFRGEYKGYNVPKEEPEGRNFYIVHEDCWNLFTRNVNPVPLKKVYLMRGHYDRMRSNRITRMTGHQMHYEEHRELTVTSNFAVPGHVDQHFDQHLLAIMNQYPGLVLTYNQLTGGKNMEQLPSKYQEMLEEHLDLVPGHRMVPRYVKPTVRVV